MWDCYQTSRHICDPGFKSGKEQFYCFSICASLTLQKYFKLRHRAMPLYLGRAYHEDFSPDFIPE